MLYDITGDHYVGQILAGLPVLSSCFAVSEQIFGSLIYLIMMLEQNKLRLMSKYHLCYNHYLVIFFADK